MKIGDRVAVLDDNLAGIITRIEEDLVYIETEDGFEMSFDADELVVVGNFRVEYHSLQQALSEEKNRIKKSGPKSSKKREEHPLEVDLHIENIANDTAGKSDYQLLNMQLDVARSQLEFAIRKKIRKVIFIHGIGKGVLRAELETLLRRYDEVEFYDADFKKYGRGATEVYIYQNPKRSL